MRVRVCVLLLFLGSLLTAAEEKPKKPEAKSVSISPSKEGQTASKSQKVTESKAEKRGAHEKQENLGPLKDEGREGGGEGEGGGRGGRRVLQGGLRTEVTHQNPLVTEKVVHVHIPVPHPYPVEFFKNVPYPVQVPVPVLVYKPFPVPVPRNFDFTVERKFPVPVNKLFPYHVKSPVEILGKVPSEVPVHEQYILPFSETNTLPLRHSDIKHIPLHISQHPENQEIHKPEVHKETQHDDSTPASDLNVPENYYYINTFNIPETRLSESYKWFTPEENYKHLTLPATHQYQNLPEYQQSSIPEAYHQEKKSPRLSSQEFNIF